MATATKKTDSEKIKQANAASAKQPNEDYDVIQSTCPLMKEKIQLLPVRYMISEPKDALPDNLNNSLYKQQGVPQTVGQLNPGFIYIIHSENTEKLYRYEVKEDQSLTGFYLDANAEQFQKIAGEGATAMIFPRKGEIKALFSPVELNFNLCDMLLNSHSDQDFIFNKLRLNDESYMLNIKDFIIENSPKVNEIYTDDIIKIITEKYFWLPGSMRSEYFSINNKPNSNFIDDYGYLCLNDIPSDISDTQNKYEGLVINYNEYLDQKEYTPANGGADFTRRNKIKIANVLNYFLSRDSLNDELLQKISPAMDFDLKQNETFAMDLSELCHQYIKNNEVIENVNYNSQLYKNSFALLKKYNVDIPTTKFTELVIETIKRHMLVSYGEDTPIIGRVGIKERIKYDEMTSYLKDYDTKTNNYASKLEDIVLFMQNISTHWHMLCAYTPSNSIWNGKAICENSFLNVVKNDDEWMKNYYYSDDIFPWNTYTNILPKLKHGEYKSLLESPFSLSSAKSFFSILYKSRDFKITRSNLNDQEKMELKKEEIKQSKKILFEVDLSQKSKFNTTVLDTFHIHNQKLLESLAQSNKLNKIQINNYYKDFFKNLPNGAQVAFKLNLDLFNLDFNPSGGGISKEVVSLCSDLKKLSDKTKLLYKEMKVLEKRRAQIRGSRKPAQQRSVKKLSEEIKIKRNEYRKLKSQLTELGKAIYKESNQNGNGLIVGGDYDAIINQNIKEGELLTKKSKLTSMIKELAMKDGKINRVELSKNVFSFFLLGYSLYTFSRVLSQYNAGSDDVDMWDVTGSGAFLLSSGLATLGIITKASIGAQIIKVQDVGKKILFLKILERVNVVTSPITAIFTFWGYGVATGNALTKTLESIFKKQRFRQIVVHGLNTVALLGGTSVAVYETYHYGRIVWTILRSRIPIGLALGAAGVLMAEIAILTMWISIGVAVAVWLTNMAVEYFTWPDIVEWADNSAWGINNELWSLSEHQTKLNEKQDKEYIEYHVQQNHYALYPDADADLNLRVTIPDVSKEAAEQVMILFRGETTRLLFMDEWVDFTNRVYDSSHAQLKNDIYQLNLQIGSEDLIAYDINKLQLMIRIKVNETKGSDDNIKVFEVPKSLCWDINFTQGRKKRSDFSRDEIRSTQKQTNQIEQSNLNQIQKKDAFNEIRLGKHGRIENVTITRNSEEPIPNKSRFKAWSWYYSF